MGGNFGIWVILGSRWDFWGFLRIDFGDPGGIFGGFLRVNFGDLGIFGGFQVNFRIQVRVSGVSGEVLRQILV